MLMSLQYIERMNSFYSFIIGVLFLLCPATDVLGWQYWGGDAGGSRYSELSQINRGNIPQLKEVWRYRTGALERHDEEVNKWAAFEATPILLPDSAGRSLVLCTPYNRVIALDPVTGEERWFFDPDIALDMRLPYVCRGVTYWHAPELDPDEECAHRIFTATNDTRIFAIDARTGKRCSRFADNGEIKVKHKPFILPGEMNMSSPPSVINGVLVVGSTVMDMMRVDPPSGVIRAFDAESGEPAWEFDPVPRDTGDPLGDTWTEEARRITGGANVWSVMSVDERRNLIFLPTSSPSGDIYGAHRPGENRYSNSVVALRGTTGEVVWHFQTLHHDVWDFDLAAQPVLVDLPVAGVSVPVVVQATKQGFIFVLHRETGEPIFPVEEKPVPQGGVGQEWLSPTQPVPVKPPPLVPQTFTEDDAWGLLLFDKWLCRRKVAALRSDGLYTPPSLQGSISMPNALGGVNWGGPAIDPNRALLVVNTNRVPGVFRLIPRDEAPSAIIDFDAASGGGQIINPQSGTPYAVEIEFLQSPLGMPCSPPPWGGLTAVDLAKGEILWEVPFGSVAGMLPFPVPFKLEWGLPNIGGPIITAGGLVFIAATMDDRFRAYNTDTGEKLWQVELPASAQATPMTYMIGGKQFVVLAAGGHAAMQTSVGDYVIAYALDEEK